MPYDEREAEKIHDYLVRNPHTEWVNVPIGDVKEMANFQGYFPYCCVDPKILNS